MPTIFHRFQTEPNAFINPADCIHPLPGFPKVCITTFSQNILTELVEQNTVKTIAHLYSANGVLPVYQIEYHHTPVGVFLSRVGAPACVVGIEEVLALGARKIVQFGSCGILNQPAVQNKIIIPTAAVRDEGTSYHYIESSDEITAQRTCIDLAAQCLRKHHVPYILGKVWTTDGIYRETLNLIRERKEQGCLAVDMECSASLAVARFRNIPLVQFLFGADNLDCDTWEQRDLTDYGLQLSNYYLFLALELALELARQKI